MPSFHHPDSMPKSILSRDYRLFEYRRSVLVAVRPVAKLRPTALTRKFASCAIRRMFFAVSVLTRELFRRVLETVECDTFAARAMSLMDNIERRSFPSIQDNAIGTRGGLSDSRLCRPSTACCRLAIGGFEDQRHSWILFTPRGGHPGIVWIERSGKRSCASS
jgi:hypothetical protein